MRFFVLTLLFVGWVTPAYAYIDPGVLGVLYQLGYAFLFGLVAVVILRPWAYIKSLFRRSNAAAPQGDKPGAASPRTANED